MKLERLRLRPRVAPPSIEPKNRLRKMAERNKRLNETKIADLQLGIECMQVNCANCKHSLCLSRRIYCSALQAKIDDIIPEYCYYFEPEPLEYKLFRRA